MGFKRSLSRIVFLLCVTALVSACGTLQVGLEPTSTFTPGAAPPPSVPATHTPVPRSPSATPTESAGAPPTPTPFAFPTVDVASGWDTYRSERFAVSFRYPTGWELDTVHGGEAYKGADGYFILDAIGSAGATIDAVTAGQVNHHLLPFGTDPAIEELEIAGQKARLILPAADASMGDQALLIARYPQPVTIQGTDYDYFALYADRAHIRTIAQTLQFTSRTGTGAFSSPWKGLAHQSQAGVWRIGNDGGCPCRLDPPEPLTGHAFSFTMGMV